MRSIAEPTTGGHSDHRRMGQAEAGSSLTPRSADFPRTTLNLRHLAYLLDVLSLRAIERMPMTLAEPDAETFRPEMPNQSQPRARMVTSLFARLVHGPNHGAGPPGGYGGHERPLAGRDGTGKTRLAAVIPIFRVAGPLHSAS